LQQLIEHEKQQFDGTELGEDPQFDGELKGLNETSFTAWFKSQPTPVKVMVCLAFGLVLALTVGGSLFIASLTAGSGPSGGGIVPAPASSIVPGPVGDDGAKTPTGGFTSMPMIPNEGFTSMPVG
jgi:hypothetical protein